MYLHSLKLLHFRNYEHLQIEFNSHLNIIYGKNGVGKTNLVEAIYVLSLTRSFRNVINKILTQKNFTHSKIEGEIYFPGNNYQDKFSIILSNEGKKVKINQTKIIKLSEYITKIPIVLFHPDDLKIIKDTPSTRRKQLNISISQYNLDYLKDLTYYNKLLKHRNSYLKKLAVNSNRSLDYLDILTDKLINYGLKIFEERKKFINDMNVLIKKIYKDIANIDNLQIVYNSDYNNMSYDDLRKTYQKSLQKDLNFGKTNIGIHMDDVVFQFADYNLKDYGSEGQQKNAVIAFKLSELMLLKRMINKSPILILDDLFSELDMDKVQNIFSLLNDNYQIFITTTELNLVKPFLKGSYKEFCINDGAIVKEVEHESK